jgi:uncharacterized protein (DUF2141 family)
MTNTKKIIFSITAGLLISILTSQCKSPATSPDSGSGSSGSTQTDTVAVSGSKADTSVVRETQHATRHDAQIPLTLIIKNFRTPKGSVVVGLYGTDNKFPNPKDQLKEYRFTPHDNKLTATIADQKFGTYALAIYQDVNGNGKIDKNLIGIPTEPYAFSQNYIPRTKAPNFDDCKFDYDETNNTITMTMIK